jgi:serine/threonine protein kinase
MSITAPKKIGRYQILNHLESGGMGAVYLARDPAIDRLVAIKLLREGFDSAELRARFLREARSAGRLQHVNIVTIFDVGEHQKRPFIAMEYLEGETLQEVIRRRALLTVGRKLQLMDELCAGLQYAHAGGIVHRDIKPSNVMLAGDGVLKVLDFGIARINDASGSSSYTQAGALMGTLNYMAPEQMIGLPDVDARADMFSAGAVFYELLTYKQAFPGGLDSGIMHKIIDASPEPAEKVDPTLDPDLIAIVNRCLEKSRDNRYPDMAAVRRDLALLRRRYDEQPPLEHKTTRRDLDRLRTTQIRSHLEEARKALGGGDFTAALEASQRALLLNGDDRDALECEQRARTGLEERQIHEWLTSARTQINLGAVTSASLLVDRALSLNSSSPEAVAVRALVDEARQRLAETRERARALEAALAGARRDLSAGAFDTASAHLDEALAIEPENAEARAIRLELRSAIEARRIAEEESRARTAMNTAREQFAAGNHAGSIAELERFEPAALVAPALEELRDEFQEIERRRVEVERQAEERRQAAEAAERLRQATARKLDDAAARLTAQDLDAARALTREVLAEQPGHDDARALDLKIDQAIEQRRLLAEAETRRRAEEEARARTAVSAAHEQFATGDHGGAIAALERFEPAALVADALDELRVEFQEIERLRIEAERQAAERRKAVEAAERIRKATARKLDDAAARLEAQDLEAARALTREVLAEQPDHSDARALDAEIDQAVERRRLMAEARQRAEEEARARTAVNTAHEQFAAGDHARAIAALERFEPAALVAEALDELRLELREIERLRIEAERQAAERRKAVEAAERLRKATARKLDDAAARFDAQDLDAARALTREVLAEQPQHTDARALDAEIDRAIERRRQVADGLASARAHIDAGRFDDARQAIAAIEKLDASVPDLVNLRRAADTGIRAANAALKRRRESEERLTAAKQAFASRDLGAALEHVTSALKIDLTNADAKALETRIQAAIQQQRDDERRRQDEQEKRAAEARVKHTPAVTSQTEDQGDETVVVNVSPPSNEPAVLTPSSPVGPLRVAPPGVSLPLPPLAPLSQPPVVGPAVEDKTIVTADTKPPVDILKYAALGSGTLAVAALVVWLVTRPAPPPPPPPPAIPGTVIFDIAPWATIEAITNKADGKATPSDCRETPCVLSLPAGEYHVRASNPNFPGTLEFDFKIESGGIREEHRSVPGFRAEDEVSKILEGKN